MKIPNYGTHLTNLGGKCTKNDEYFPRFDTGLIRLHFSRFKKRTHDEKTKFLNPF